MSDPMNPDPPAHPIDVDAILALDEDTLERQCRFEAFKTGGPGGQKRNKTSSAARLTHVRTGVSAHSSDFRSQSENRHRALHRLRFRFAAEHRTPIDRRGYEPPAWLVAAKVQGKLTTNTKNPLYARLAAHVLDVFAACEGHVANAAALLGISNNNLVHVLHAEPAIWAAAAKIRKTHALEPLPARS
jgi:hypothetical protein